MRSTTPRATIRCRIRRAQSVPCQRGWSFGERQRNRASSHSCDNPRSFRAALRLYTLRQHRRNSPAHVLGGRLAPVPRHALIGHGGDVVATRSRLGVREWIAHREVIADVRLCGCVSQATRRSRPRSACIALRAGRASVCAPTVHSLSCGVDRMRAPLGERKIVRAVLKPARSR